MAIVYLGIGSNLGNRALNIKKALSRLEDNKISVTKLSTVIETDPVGGPAQGKYLNAVLEAKTNLSPDPLRQLLKAIERELGRKRTVRNGPRTIDLDILLYNRETIKTDDLKIPHPRMLERDFVMTPLAEIAPELVRELRSSASTTQEFSNAPRA